MRRHSDDYYPHYFGRNTGIYSDEQIGKIREARIGIAGLGGSGGYSFLFLVHMGFESFKIADPDVYEEHNKNRQVGALSRNIGRPKTESLLELAKGLNPYIEVDVFHDGILPSNAQNFVEGTDFVIETMDFNVPGAKFSLHDAAASAGVYISTSPSPTYGAPVYNFGPKTPSFGEIFGLDPIRLFEDPQGPRRFVERLALPNLEDYPPDERTRILDHCYRAAARETHLSSNIMGVSTSAQLLCMAALETVLFGSPRVLIPHVLVLDHMTHRYKSVDLRSLRWEH